MFKRVPKWLLITLGILIALRIVLLFAIVPVANRILKTYSSHFEGRIEDVDLHFFRGAYQVEGIQAYFKDKPDETFLKIREVDVSLAWRDLFWGRLQTDIQIDGLRLSYSKKLLNAAKAQLEDMNQEDREEVKETLFPLRVASFSLQNSSVDYSEIPQFPVRVSDVNLRVSNVTPTPKSPVTFLNLTAELQDSAKLKVTGVADPTKKPVEWSLGAEMMDFNLPAVNGFLRTKGPLSFTNGTMDVYSEMKSENGQIEGYLKPFIENMKVIGNKRDFKNLKHFGLELGSAAINGLLKRDENETLATKIVFSYQPGNFQWNASKALGSTLENTFDEELQPGLENRYQTDALPGEGENR